MTIACRALIFDMDGLMIDSEPVWWRVEKALASERGLTWTDAMAQQCIGKGLPNVIVTMQKNLGLDMSLEDGVAELHERFIGEVDRLTLKPGLVELVAAAEGAALRRAVASSSTRRLIDAVLTRFSMIERFEAIMSGDAVEASKPHPEIFLRSAALLDTAPADCVVLEDSLAGVQAGVASGATVIAVPELEPEPMRALTPHVVTDLHEARALLGL